MERIILLILLILLIIAFFLLYKVNKKKKELEEEQSNQFLNYYNQHINGIEEKFSQRKDELFREYEDKRKECQEKLDTMNALVEYKKELLESEQDKISRVLSEQKKTIDSELKRYKDLSLLQIQQVIKEEEKKAEDNFNAWKTTFELDKQTLEKEKKEILEELEDFRKRRAAINEAILREKEIKEKEDFYRIILTEDDKKDIRFLIDIANQIQRKETLYKLIWSEYLQKPFNDLIKRLFKGNVPSNVIYCIENINTKQKYIGKTSAEVSKRWTEHIKTSLNIGTARKSKIHDGLYCHWDEFYFYIIEKATKEKLGEREKYWIDFYETKNQLNMKAGG